MSDQSRDLPANPEPQSVARLDSKKSSLTTDVTTETPPYPYTVFNKKEKYFIAFICGTSAFWSAVLGNIYYPIIYTIEKDFNVSEELANTSVVLYLLLQGLSPMFTASVADTVGRKPVVLACCIVYIVVCCCIAKSNVYWLILVLRCLQAGGIAPVVAINSGVAADLATRANRGSLIGFSSGIQLLAMAVGALLGGLLAAGFHSWRAIFWFVAIGCGVTTVMSFLFLPETKRSIVGNGSIPPKRFINKSPLWLIPHFKKKLTNDAALLEPNNAKSIVRKLLDVPIIVSRYEIIMILLPTSLYFATWTMMFTSLSTTLQSARGYSVLHVGLCFIAPGVAGSTGSFISGRVLDRVYKYFFKKHEKALERWEKTKEGPKPILNLFKCRLIILFPAALIYNSGVLIFAWSLGEGAPLAPVLIGAFMASLVNSSYVAASTNLLADLFPTMTSTSTACVNFTRCVMSACGVAAIAKMQAKLTVGGCFTLMVGLCVLGLIPLWIVMHKGMDWHMKRLQKAQ